MSDRITNRNARVGTKVHFRRRSGWLLLKTEPHDWFAAPVVMVPEQLTHSIARSVAFDGSQSTIENQYISRQFELVKSGEIRNHRTGVVAKEFWYEEI